jgi:hypothetical protein
MDMKYCNKELNEKKYIQIAKNYYALRSEWQELKPDQRHTELCACIAKRRKAIVYTGQSACAIRGVARLSPLDLRAHAISEKCREAGIVYWHYGPLDPHTEIIKEMYVVSPIRMICDLALTDTPESLLITINDCLYKQLFTKEQFMNEIKLRVGMKGRKRLMRLGAFATAKCESPLETIAWIALYKAGFVMPQQQVSIYDGYNFVGRVDMYWEFRGRKLILELDGKLKYADDGGSAVYAEKVREDKLRSLDYEFIRGSWSDVINGQLAQRAKDKGVPMRRNFGKHFPPRRNESAK